MIRSMYDLVHISRDVVRFSCAVYALFSLNLQPADNRSSAVHPGDRVVPRAASERPAAWPRGVARAAARRRGGSSARRRHARVRSAWPRHDAQAAARARRRRVARRRVKEQDTPFAFSPPFCARAGRATSPPSLRRRERLRAPPGPRSRARCASSLLLQSPSGVARTAPGSPGASCARSRLRHGHQPLHARLARGRRGRRGASRRCARPPLHLCPHHRQPLWSLRGVAAAARSPPRRCLDAGRRGYAPEAAIGSRMRRAARPRL